MRMTIKRLQNRNGKLRYRRKVPAHLRPFFGGRREIVQALGLSVGQEGRALAAVQSLDRQYDPLFLQAERAYRAGQDPHALAAKAEEWALRNKFIGLDRSGANADHGEVSEYDLWLETEVVGPFWRAHQREPELHELDAETRLKIATVKRGTRVPVALTFGRATDAYTQHQHEGSLPKAEATAVAQFEEWVAAHSSFRKITKGDPKLLPLSEVNRAIVAEFLLHLHSVRQQSAATIRRRINSLKAIWSFTPDHFEEAELRNPWEKQKPPKAAREAQSDEAQKRLPFTIQHLVKLDAYTRRNDIDPHIRGLLRLLCYTGARPMEIGGLLKSDVFLDVATPWIWLRPNSVRGLKTKGSERRVPIADEVLADIKNLTDAAKLPSTPLFPEVFHDTSSLSYRANAAIRAAGIPKSPRLVAYSFRHTVNQAMLVSNASQHLRFALLGHSDPSMNARYGAGGVDLVDLKAAMEIAFERLGEAPEYVYTADEWV